uniref:Secreted protein n=1 Tax=Theropithecus gelada TaxID=9565 RepID=A0A8D2K5Y7_THEGE
TQLPCTLNRCLLLMAAPEVLSTLLSLFGSQFTSRQETYRKSPFWIFSILSEDIARNFTKRMVCAKFYLYIHTVCIK